MIFDSDVAIPDAGITEEAVIQDEMVMDLDSFDFNSLDDIPHDDNELGYSTKQTGKDLMEAEDLADIDEEEEEALPDEDEDTDFAEEDEGDETEEVQEEVTEEEVEYDSYELTLPSGETVVLSDLVAGYKSAKELDEAKTFLMNVKKEFEEKAGGISKHLELAKLEAERVIEDYADFDWGTLSREDHQAYVENREFLDKYKARLKEIKAAQADMDARMAAEAQKANAEQARNANMILARDIPGWNKTMYADLMGYAVEQGYDPAFISNCVDPTTFKMLHKARQFEQGVQRVTAKVKKVGSPTKVVKAEAAKPRTGSGTAPAKTAVLKKIQATGDMTDAFAFLED